MARVLGIQNICQGLPEVSVAAAATQTIFDTGNKEALSTAYPLISNILARIAVLPASSAHVERLFSTMKRIKTAQRNRLKTETLDCLPHSIIVRRATCAAMESRASPEKMGVLGEKKTYNI